MSTDLHARLPWNELALSARTLSGRIDAARLAPRLGEALAREHPAGTVEYELHFAPGAPAGGAVRVTGRITARLEATCQRCLQDFDLETEVPVEVDVATCASPGGGDQVAGGPEQGDADLLTGLAGLIEEELLLTLPFLPSHPEAECPATPAESGGERGSPQEVQRPFAGLRAALDKARDGGKG